MFGYLCSHLRITFGAILLFHVFLRSYARPINSSNNVNVIFECIIHQPCDNNCRSSMMMAIEISNDNLNNITLPVIYKKPFCRNNIKQVVIYDKEKEISLSAYYFEFKDDKLHITFNENILNKKNMYSIYIPCELATEQTFNKKILKENEDIILKETNSDNSISSPDNSQCQDLSTVHRDILLYTGLLKTFPETKNFPSTLLFLPDCSSKDGSNDMKQADNAGETELSSKRKILQRNKVVKRKIQQGTVDEMSINDNVDTKSVDDEKNLNTDMKNMDEKELMQNSNTKLPKTKSLKYPKSNIINNDVSQNSIKNHEKMEGSFAIKTHKDDCNTSSDKSLNNLNKFRKEGRIYDDRRQKRFYIFVYRDSERNYTGDSVILDDCADPETTDGEIGESSTNDTKSTDEDREYFKNSTYRNTDIIDKKDKDIDPLNDSPKVNNDEDEKLWDFRRRRSMHKILLKGTKEDFGENSLLNLNSFIDGGAGVVIDNDDNRQEKLHDGILQSVHEIATQNTLLKDSKIDENFDNTEMNKTETYELFSDNVDVPYVRHSRDLKDRIPKYFSLIEEGNVQKPAKKPVGTVTEKLNKLEKMSKKKSHSDYSVEPTLTSDNNDYEMLDSMEDDMGSTLPDGDNADENNADTINSYGNQSLDEILQNGNDYHILEDEVDQSTVSTYDDKSKPDTENVSLPIDESLLTGNFSHPVTHLNVTSEKEYEGEESEIVTTINSTGGSSTPATGTSSDTEVPPVIDISTDSSTAQTISGETSTEPAGAFLSPTIEPELFSAINTSTETLVAADDVLPSPSEASLGPDEYSISNKPISTDPVSPASTETPLTQTSLEVGTSSDSVVSLSPESESLSSTTDGYDISNKVTQISTPAPVAGVPIDSIATDTSEIPLSPKPSTIAIKSDFVPVSEPSTSTVASDTTTVVINISTPALIEGVPITDTTSTIKDDLSTIENVTDIRSLDKESYNSSDILQASLNSDYSSIVNNNNSSRVPPIEKSNSTYVTKKLRIKSKASNFYSSSYITVSFITLTYFYCNIINF